jgi:hypothetical protein
MDYDKTSELYQKYGQAKAWNQVPDKNRHEKEKAWYEKVKSKRTGAFYQADELIKRELVPEEDWEPPYGKEVEYPIKHVNEIIRKRVADGSEWLLSRQMWHALDQIGNTIDISMNDKEMYNDVLPIRTLKPENPKDNPRFRDTKMVNVIDRLEKRMKYTEPFTPETVQKLYDMRNGECTLVIINEIGDHNPYEVTSLEAFKTRPFEELWEMVTTPKYKMEPSTTQEDHKQYG